MGLIKWLRIGAELALDLVREARQERAAKRAAEAAKAPKRAEMSRRYQEASHRAGRCDRAAVGWVCTRAQGHVGPCAAKRVLH